MWQYERCASELTANNSQDMRDAFFDELASVAEQDDRVVFLTADHGAQSLDRFQEKFPQRFYNIGIAEQNMVSMAGGLASKGKIPVVYGIAPFVSLRALEQVTLDVASMNLPVTIVGIGPGFCYSTDGYTHHGLQDVGAMATVPNLTILNSSDPVSTKLFASEIGQVLTPRYVRIEKGTLAPLSREFLNWTVDGFATVRQGGGKILVVSTGSIVHEVLVACDELKSDSGLDPTVLDIHRLKPLAVSDIADLIATAEHTFVIEESYSYLAKEIALELSVRGQVRKFATLSVREEFFSKGGSRDLMRVVGGVSKAQIVTWMKQQLG